ncbi:MAG: hypothetical protein KF704_02050 [Crocinitomicaceae bacterium]|nr:hypothetical protein [Crocinitomicaceae bacterium]
MKRHIWIEIISYAFILLFMYTAIAKLITYDTSLNDLKRSPFISDFALPLSILLPVSEIAISVLIFIPKYRKYGLIGATVLMALFTGYVSAMVFTQETLPCSCGGLIKYLTWKQHFFFNIFFTLLGVVGIIMLRKLPDQPMDNLKYDQSI